MRGGICSELKTSYREIKASLGHIGPFWGRLELSWAVLGAWTSGIAEITQTKWKPEKSIDSVISDTYLWMKLNIKKLKSYFK